MDKRENVQPGELQTTSSIENTDAGDIESFRRFAFAAYILLIVTVFTLLVASLGIMPGIALTLGLLLMDIATMNAGKTLIYVLGAVLAMPVFFLYTWLRDRLSSNLQKEPTYKEKNANCLGIASVPIEGESVVTNNPSPSGPFFKEKSKEDSLVSGVENIYPKLH